MSSKSFLRSGLKYLNFWATLSHLCLFVCQSCLFVCQSALSLECLTSASSVTTLLGPLLWLTLHRGEEKFLLQQRPTQTPALSV